ncbi:G-protein coupled receptor 62-like [Dipodomys merriami]|uniref:G-protein coupled receptor 62-like n=1 Tax=Dipodomys merriami TaxID=94247 RepID=UPI003855E3F3
MLSAILDQAAEQLALMANSTVLLLRITPAGSEGGSMGFILAVLVEVGTLLGNGALLIVVVRTPGLQDGLYLVHLCVVDLLAAASIMPLGLLAAPPSGLGRMPLGPAWCRAARFLSAALLPACTLGVAALALARYRFIAHPLHPGIRPRPGLVLTTVWTSAGILGVLSLLGPPPGPPPAPARCSVLAGGLGPFRPLWALLAFALPAFLLLGAYGSIFLVARRAATLRPPGPRPGGARLRSDSLDSRLSFLPPLRSHLPGGKAALAPSLAIGQFAACWLPYGFACLAPVTRAAEAETAVTWLAYSAFAVHPFLYGLLQRPVRLALCRLTRQALPRPCAAQAWHPGTLLHRLQRPPVLAPCQAPDHISQLAEGQSPVSSTPQAT